MGRYIDADKFVSYYRNLYCKKCKRRKNSNGKFVYKIGAVVCSACEINDVLNDVEDYPSADVKELKHGKWIKKSDDSVVCSECGFFDSYIDEYGDGTFTEYKDENRFCRHCGAKMERAEK